MSIFISYAKEDTEFAHELYSALKARGLEPWMDKPPAPYQADGLIPGEDWRRRLSEEIRRAVRVILVLSSTSIAKVGYVQNEFRLALEAMAYMPPNTRFAIPLLIEDCTPPDLVVGSISLANLQWTNLDEIEMDVFLNMVEADLGR